MSHSAAKGAASEKASATHARVSADGGRSHAKLRDFRSVSARAGGHQISAKGDLDFGVASGDCGIHSRQDSLNVLLQDGPLLVAENHEGNSPSSQVLLVTNVFVGRQQNVKAVCFGRRYQVAVQQPVPASFNRLDRDVPFESVTKGGRYTVIEEDAHLASAGLAAPAALRGFGPQTR